MSKKKIELYPTDQNTHIHERKDIVEIIEKKENAFVYVEDTHNAKGLLPFSRFISEEEISRVQIHSKVAIYRYFNASGKRLLAYHAKCE